MIKSLSYTQIYQLQALKKIYIYPGKMNFFAGNSLTGYLVKARTQRTCALVKISTTSGYQRRKRDPS